MKNEDDKISRIKQRDDTINRSVASVDDKRISKRTTETETNEIRKENWQVKK